MFKKFNKIPKKSHKKIKQDENRPQFFQFIREKDLNNFIRVTITILASVMTLITIKIVILSVSEINI